MGTLLVNTAGILLMVAIVWWFWVPPATADASKDTQNHH